MKESLQAIIDVIEDKKRVKPLTILEMIILTEAKSGVEKAV